MICAIPRAWCGRPQEPTSVWGATSGKPQGDTKTTLAHPAYAQRTHHEGNLGGQRTAARIQSAEVMEKNLRRLRLVWANRIVAGCGVPRFSN
jgi:hypothetical protein